MGPSHGINSQRWQGQTKFFLMCLALQKGLVDDIIDNREFDILIDRLDLREEHNKCPFMGVEEP